MKVIKFLLLSFFLASGVYGIPANKLPVEELKPIGSATLKKMFWTIYDSTLFNETGVYEGVEPNLALSINYRRDIKAELLLKNTRKEWQKMDLYKQQQSEAWLTSLTAIWPDITKGDVLTLHVDDELASQFYFNNKPIGVIENPAFTRDFLAIWLAEDCSYPKLRDRLIGKKS